MLGGPAAEGGSLTLAPLGLPPHSFSVRAHRGLAILPPVSPARAILPFLVLLGGCMPEVGDCDPTAAVNVAYDGATGMPAYEGQALVLASCASGFCHSDAIRECNRAGVPAGLTFDVRLAASDGTVDEEAIARQRRARFRVVQESQGILHTLDLGTMPPPPSDHGLCPDFDPPVTVGDVRESAPVYFGREAGSATLVPLPAIDTPEAREIVRNWLACGAPVVERPVPRDDGSPSVVSAQDPRDPLAPTWTSIYEDLLVARGCGSSACHGGASTNVGFHVRSSSSETYAELVGAIAGGDVAGPELGCQAMGTLVMRGVPDESLLLAKLGPADAVPCGDAMPSGGIPLSAADLAAIRAWIEAGAPETE